VAWFPNLAADLRTKAAAYDLPPTRAALLRMLVNDGSAAQIMFRTMRFCQTHHLKPLAAIIYRLNAFITTATLGRNADLGPGFVILHSIGVVIHSNVRAGRNLVVYHGVTLGAEHGKTPVLGDNVYIGAGAKVIGGVHIGSNVRIGANAVVTKDIPDGATVVGIPARIIRLNGLPVDANPAAPFGPAAND
jgi:serine O-acetyltransferase